MRSLRILIVASALLAAGCAGLETAPEMTRADIVRMTRAGDPPAAIVERLKSTRSVVWVTAAEAAELREAGVAPEVLDYVQAAQISEMRRRAQFDQLLYGPERTPFSRCSGFPTGDGRFGGFFAPFC